VLCRCGFDEWYKVRSLDGIIGYIEKKYVAVRRYVDRIALIEPKSAAWKPEDGKIVMVWEQVHSPGANPDTSKIPEMPGLDIVSPTWFSLVGRDGEIESRASALYIEWAHRNGYQVWVLFANTMNDIDMTSEFLNNSQSRENAIRTLLAYTAMLDVDGVNLDFENVYLKDRDALTQFVRELAPMLREQGLTFSVDVNIPDGSDTWSRCYDTPAIADAADYVNLMAYDQFGASSRESGSVSQLSWVEANLKKLIERDGVPPEKILLGIPFYTRIWEMERANAARGDPPKSSSAVGMRTAINGIFDNDATVEWDASSGQFFCSYKKEGKNYHVWLEDPHSANLRSSLAHKYALAGVSAWSRNFAIPEIWDVLERNMKEYITYGQWQAEASVDAPDLARIR
jgi:spore germination protein YaaH